MVDSLRGYVAQPHGNNNVSEYQCYEFLAIDRPLTAKQIAELRAISTRAEISPTRFYNEYQWGNLKADPARLMERYFDAHLYLANWGTHRLMLRVPKARLHAEALKQYFVGNHAASIRFVSEYAVFDFTSDSEDFAHEEEPQASLDALTPLRTELMQGDLRSAYLGWLLAVQMGDVDDDATEPAVPEGLEQLTGAQQAMADFLRIDPDLITAAAKGSTAPKGLDAKLRRWVKALSAAQKDKWLQQAVAFPDLALGAELLRAFRATSTEKDSGNRRTVRELHVLGEDARTERELAEAARAKKARQEAERARSRRLDLLSRDVDAAWSNLESLVAASDYENAVQLAVDLKALARRNGEDEAFKARFEAMRKRQARRRGFFDRWKNADEAYQW